MTHILNWLISRRYRVIVSAIAFSPIFPIVSSSLITLSVMVNGYKKSIQIPLISSLIVTVLLLYTGTTSSLSIFLSILPLYAGLFLGYLIYRTNSINFVFQAIYLLCFLIVLASLFFNGFNNIFANIFDQIIEIFLTTGAPESQINSLNSWRELFFSLIVAIVFIQLVISLFLTVWWYSLIKKENIFFYQFKALRLGKFLGLPATLLLFFSIFSDTIIIDSFFSLILIAFCIQGIALVHDYGSLINLHPAILALMYILLVTPLTGFVILLLSLIGLVDNWINLRSLYRN
ncbi:MAG: DUF2232 domain-containing protein [Pseudomonadota bacterium]|nr:hypothetical protein [Gammaproteobacteria bacterium]MEE2683819.1 DUF2232 domain-containing protein [Pseudomonadota bacterium]